MFVFWSRDAIFPQKLSRWFLFARKKELRNDVKIRNVGSPVKNVEIFLFFIWKFIRISIWCLFVRQWLNLMCLFVCRIIFWCFNRKSMLEVDLANRYGKTMVWEKNTPCKDGVVYPFAKKIGVRCLYLMHRQHLRKQKRHWLYLLEKDHPVRQSYNAGNSGSHP